MGRSVKKGPFVQPVLLKRVQEMNETGEKKDREDLEPMPPPSSRILSVTPLRSTTAASTSRFM